MMPRCVNAIPKSSSKASIHWCATYFTYSYFTIFLIWAFKFSFKFWVTALDLSFFCIIIQMLQPNSDATIHVIMKLRILISTRQMLSDAVWFGIWQHLIQEHQKSEQRLSLLNQPSIMALNVNCHNPHQAQRYIGSNVDVWHSYFLIPLPSLWKFAITNVSTPCLVSNAQHSMFAPC